MRGRNDEQDDADLLAIQTAPHSTAAADAVERVLVKFRSHWRGWASAYPTLFDHDEARQIARIAVFDCARNYDPTRPAGPLIAVAIRRKFSTEYKHHVQPPRDFRRQTVKLDAPAASSLGDDPLVSVIPARDPDHVAEIGTREIGRRIARRLRRVLSDYEARVLALRGRGLTLAEIAAATSTTAKQADNATTRCSRKVADLLCRHGIDKLAPEDQPAALIAVLDALPPNAHRSSGPRLPVSRRRGRYGKNARRPH